MGPPFDQEFLHTTKPIKVREPIKRHGRTIGVPLEFGWPASRLSELAVNIGYTQKSTGMFCSNHGYAFIFEGTDDPEDCLKRCTFEPACMYFTAYSTGWCQIISRCNEEHTAGDGTSVTYQKEFPVDICPWHSPNAECYGDWVAALGKPIKKPPK